MCYMLYHFYKTWGICSLFKAKQSICQVLDMAAFYGNTNILMSIHIYLTDLKAKWIKSKISKYKINNNNTNTKHEFKLNMKDINKILANAHFKCNIFKWCEQTTFFLGGNLSLRSCWNFPCHAFISTSWTLRETSSLPIFCKCGEPSMLFLQSM